MNKEKTDTSPKTSTFDSPEQSIYRAMRIIGAGVLVLEGIQRRSKTRLSCLQSIEGPQTLAERREIKAATELENAFASTVLDIYQQVLRARDHFLTARAQFRLGNHSAVQNQLDCGWTLTMRIATQIERLPMP